MTPCKISVSSKVVLKRTGLLQLDISSSDRLLRSILILFIIVLLINNSENAFRLIVFIQKWNFCLWIIVVIFLQIWQRHNLILEIISLILPLPTSQYVSFRIIIKLFCNEGITNIVPSL